MGRPASNPRRTALPGVRNAAAVNADVGTRPSPGWGRHMGWREVDRRRRHLNARQSRRSGPEHNRCLGDIPKSTTPRRAAPGMGAFLQINLRALRNTLHHGRPAARRGAHGGRRCCHRQFGACLRHKGEGKAKPKTKTPNHSAIPSFMGKDRASKIIATPSAKHMGRSLAEVRSPSLDAVTRFLSPAMSDRLVRTPVQCGNCHWPSSCQAATLRRA
jgi:hypothetical protein